MKLNRIFFSVLACAVLAASCTKMEDIVPQGSTMLEKQVKVANQVAPSRAAASFTGMFTNIGKPAKMYSTPDDWEFLMINFCNDLEGADALIADSGYNWFSVCGELSSRNANYRNPAIRYRAPYNMISDVNTFLNTFDPATASDEAKNMMAQAKCLRAWSYMLLATGFQFNYQYAADQPCVPVITADVDVTNNPRATVKEVYENHIIADLNEAIKVLEGSTRSSKMYIDGQVAHGLRARAYLSMGKYQEAYDDAVAAAKGYYPATLAEVSKPSFMDISEHNWIWGYDMTSDVALAYRYATTSSWLRSFSAWSYSAACQVTTCINTLLWDKIGKNDIRKQWWVDEDLKSTLIEGMTWPGCAGDVAHASDGGDAKLPYLPYTNVKFGCLTVGTTSNDEDMPLMRVEEMILIQAECMCKLGKTSDAEKLLVDFVGTNREPGYTVKERGLSLIDEIWFQRRVELWGEGFFNEDMKRLNKPLVRFHDDTNNMPAAFRFNLPAGDPWLLMRFPQGELNTNHAIKDNTGGQQPVTDQNPTLLDGVTD